MITLPSRRIGILILSVIPMICAVSTGSLGQGQRQTEVQIKLSWEYTGLSRGMRAYEAREGAVLKVWVKGSVKEEKDMAMSREVANSNDCVALGGHKNLDVVF